MTDAEWYEVLEAMDRNRDVVRAWPASEPTPLAVRCEFSLHRTLAHLRAAQEYYLEPVLAFAQRDNPSLTVLHAWRRFSNGSYERMPWDEHLAAYLRDRKVWEELVRNPALDRSRGGRFNRKPSTIDSLTRALVAHEQHHIEALA